MRGVWRAALAAVCCLVLVACQPRQVVRDSHHRVIDMAKLHGRWVLVNVWAGWCAPCMREMPVLNHWYHAHGKRVMVLGLNYDHASDDRLNLFAKAHHIDFPLLSHMPLADWFDVKEIATVPMTLVIAPSGKLVRVLNGPLSAKDLEKITNPSLVDYARAAR